VADFIFRDARLATWLADPAYRVTRLHDRTLDKTAMIVTAWRGRRAGSGDQSSKR
jgi:hypothetical protein